MRKFKPYYIIKASGKKERFSVKKLIRSLKQSGTSSKLIDKIIYNLKKAGPFDSANDIYKFIRGFLQKSERGAAGRYSLKAALMEFGPTGFPFEKFVAQVFKAQDFKVKVGQIIDGFCVSHELDVVAQKDNNHFMVECKFHNHKGLKTTVRVPLYIKARFDDVKKRWIKIPGHKNKFHEAYIFTNTRFTTNAIKYAQCVDSIKLVGWSYPAKNNLAQLIDNFGLHPITALSSLTRPQKKILLEKGVVLCSQLCKNKLFLNGLMLSDSKIERILSDAKAVCSLKS